MNNITLVVGIALYKFRFASQRNCSVPVTSATTALQLYCTTARHSSSPSPPCLLSQYSNTPKKHNSTQLIITMSDVGLRWSTPTVNLLEGSRKSREGIDCISRSVLLFPQMVTHVCCPKHQTCCEGREYVSTAWS